MAYIKGADGKLIKVSKSGKKQDWPQSSYRSVQTVVGKEVVESDPKLKGQWLGNCNVTACQRPGAYWFNTGMNAYYCRSCAHKINYHPNDDDLCFERIVGESGDQVAEIYGIKELAEPIKNWGKSYRAGVVMHKRNDHDSYYSKVVLYKENGDFWMAGRKANVVQMIEAAGIRVKE